MRDVQSSVVRMLNAYGIPADIVEEYDCVPVRIRRVGDSVKLQTMFGARAVKVVLGDGEQVRHAFEVAEYLAKNGYHRVPRFIRNRYGDPYIRDDDRYYYMADWLSGRSIDVYDIDQLTGAMEALAAWHLAVKGAMLTEKTTLRRSFVTELARLRDEAQLFWQQSRTKPERTKFEQLFAGFAKDILLKAKESMEELEKLSWNEFEERFLQEGWLCHGGCSADDVRYDGEDYAIINYEQIYAGCPLTDVAAFLSRYLQEHQWNFSAAESLTTAYLAAVGEVEWRPFLVALLAAPMEVLQLVREYQQQEYSDEGFYADALEQALQQQTHKVSTLAALRTANNSDSLPAEQEYGEAPKARQEDVEDNVVHADLKVTKGSKPVDAEVAHLAESPTSVPKGQRQAGAGLSKQQSSDELQLRIRKYKPRRRIRPTRSDRPFSAEQVKLWGDAHDPRD